MKVREAWLRARESLRAGGVPGDGLEAEALLRHAMRVDRVGFFQSLDAELPTGVGRALDGLVQRRADREPHAYIVGSREFHGLDFEVDSRVLVPRQETELLVDEVLGLAARRPDGPLLVADVGTGSGAIAVAVARRLSRATVFATDVSRGALEVADANRHGHGVSERVGLLHGDLLGPLPGPVDVIVSNPPYIPSHEIDGLDPEVRREPRRALDGGPTGLDTVAALLEQAPPLLRPGGMLAVEIGPAQLGRVLDLGRSAFPDAEVSHLPDLLGLPRVVRVRLPARPEGPGARSRAAAPARA